MLGLLGVSAFVTALSFLAIQHSQSKEPHIPPPNNIPILSVVFMVTLILSYWVNGILEGTGPEWKAGSKLDISDASYESNLVSRIPDNCFIGSPPF